MTALAFAGAGTITVAHGLAAEALGIPVRAVASRTSERAAERAGQVGARTCTYDELPAGTDLVVVATPPARHVHDALHAVERGAAALVEKPLATTLTSADALVAADPDGISLGYAENLAFAPIVRQALASISELGELQHLEARSLQAAPTWGDFLRPSWGGGVLFDLGVHPLALVLLAARPAVPVAVRAQLDDAAAVGLAEVDVWAEVHLTFDSGLTARVEASWRQASPEWDLQAASASGVVRVELLPYLQLEIGGEPEPVPQAPEGSAVPQVHQYGYVAQLDAMMAARHDGRAMPLGARFGRQVLDVVCAAYASAGHDGATVSLPFGGPRDRTPFQLWRPR